MILVILLFGFIVVYWSITRPFCANSGSCKESFSLKIENGSVGVFNNQKIPAPKISDNNGNPQNVLGVKEFYGEKHIYIDLSTQTLKAYEDQNLVMEAYVSTGKWFDTPSGEFKIWTKLKATRMSGGSGDGFYDLPNVPYVMFFEGEKAPAMSGFGIHGAYWHNNFGHPMSHGCVNMRRIDAEKLFGWAEVGTKITIYGQAPI